jgi:competence protein ComEA
MKSMDFFSFTKRERAGIITLVILLLLFAVAPKFVCNPKPVAVNISAEQMQHFSIKTEYVKERWDSARKYAYRQNAYKKYPQYTVYKKPGKYEDYKPRFTAPYKSRSAPQIIDINTADTTALIALPGIGSKLATRIILFREKLGGFHSIGQVQEVYGLKDSVFQRILPLLKCDSENIKKLDINKAGKDDLKQHPYIRWQGANALIEYREQHGVFDSLHDLANINSLDSGALNKMMPYLTVY